ncbi:MAG: hypothetical protein R3B55_00920 [Candidatus Paceibacterota bacterium]
MIIQNVVLMRYLKDDVVENIVGTIKKPAITSETSKNYLTPDIKLLSNKISLFFCRIRKNFFLTKESGGSDGFSYEFKNQSKKIWNSKFSDWILSGLTKHLLLTTRASGKYPEHIHFRCKKQQSKILFLMSRD